MKQTKIRVDWLNGPSRPPRKGLAQMTLKQQEEAFRRWSEIQDYDFPLQDQLKAAERCIGSCLRLAGLPGDLRGLNRRFTRPPALIALVDAARQALVVFTNTKDALAAGDWPRAASRAYVLGVAVEQLRARVNYGTTTGSTWAPKHKKRGEFFRLVVEAEKRWREKFGSNPSDGQLYRAILQQGAAVMTTTRPTSSPAPAKSDPDMQRRIARSREILAGIEAEIQRLQSAREQARRALEVKTDAAKVRITKAGKYQYHGTRGWRNVPSEQSFRNQRSMWRKRDITL